MRFIYIQNYLTTSRETKLEFLSHIGKQTTFRVINQKIILNDNSLILELEEDSNIEFAKQYIEDFFDKYRNIDIKKVNNIIQDKTQIILDFDDKKKKKVLL